MKRRDHATALEARPDVVAWVRRLRRLLHDMPPNVCFYVASDTIEVMDRCAEGTEASPGERQQHVVTSVGARGWDGGDW